MWNKRGDGYQPKWNLVQDDHGAPLGMAYFERAPLLADIEIIKKFLIHFKRQEKTEMETSDKVNMVFLAGVMKFDPKAYDNAIKGLIDVGMKGSIPVEIQTENSNGLAEKFLKFRQGDPIKVVAMLRPYGVKKDDGSWKNGIAIRITQIKTDPPKRQPLTKQAAMDDEIPF